MSSENANRIVIVDDEIPLLRVMKRALEGLFDAEITTFSEPFAAMNFIMENPVDLAIVDYKMPSINGVDFLSAIKSTRPEMVRIIMSGQPSSDFLEEAVNEAEIFRFIKIPWDTQQLYTIVHKALKASKTNQLKYCGSN